MTNKWIYSKVSNLIKKYETRDPRLLASYLNVNIRYLDDTKALLGMYTMIMKNRYIFIAKNLGHLENLILAHELGHDILHKDYCKKGASFYEKSLYNINSRYEIEANIFAAHLLISDEKLIAEIKNTNNILDLAKILDVDVNLLSIKLKELSKLKIIDIDTSFLEIPISKFLKGYSHGIY